MSHQSQKSPISALESELREIDELLEGGACLQTLTQRWLRSFENLDPNCEATLTDHGRPLEAGGRVYGHLDLQNSSLDESTIFCLMREGLRLFERAQHVDELGRLKRSGASIGSGLSLQSTLQIILETALEVTGARHGIFRLLSQSGEELVTAAVAGEGMDRPMVEALPVRDKHITGWVAENRESVRIGDLHQEPWAGLYFPLDQLLEMRSEMAVPLLDAHGRLEGVLNLESPKVGAFSPGDQLLLETFAGQAVVAIQQARLLDAMQEIAECVLAWPCEEVLQKIVVLSSLLLDAKGVRLAYTEDEICYGLTDGNHLSVKLSNLGEIVAYLDSHGDWERKVLTCFAHHAVLAIENQDRQKQLKLSEQRQAVTEAFAAVGDLSANLLHQLNNKVGIIPVRIEGIRDKCSDAITNSAYLDRNLSEIQNSAQGALEVVRKNMSILRPRPTGSVELGTCIQDALREVKLSIEVTIDLNLPAVRGDRKTLTLVFVNLLENAERAMKGQGQVDIRGREEAKMAYVLVTDNGPGIPLDRQEAVFQFSSDRSRPHNLGFGLWWVKTVMQRFGGGIKLVSDGQSGTSFELSFPIYSEGLSDV